MASLRTLFLSSLHSQVACYVLSLPFNLALKFNDLPIIGVLCKFLLNIRSHLSSCNLWSCCIVTSFWHEIMQLFENTSQSIFPTPPLALEADYASILCLVYDAAAEVLPSFYVITPRTTHLVFHSPSTIPCYFTIDNGQKHT